MGRSEHDPGAEGKPAWNTGRKLGAKRALKPQRVWAIRFWLDSKKRMRDLAIDSELRGCDIVKMKIGDIVLGGRVRAERHRCPLPGSPGEQLGRAALAAGENDAAVRFTSQANRGLR